MPARWIQHLHPNESHGKTSRQAATCHDRPFLPGVHRLWPLRLANADADWRRGGHGLCRRGDDDGTLPFGQAGGSAAAHERAGGCRRSARRRPQRHRRPGPPHVGPIAPRPALAKAGCGQSPRGPVPRGLRATSRPHGPGAGRRRRASHRPTTTPRTNWRVRPRRSRDGACTLPRCFSTATR